MKYLKNKKKKKKKKKAYENKDKGHFRSFSKV